MESNVLPSIVANDQPSKTWTWEEKLSKMLKSGSEVEIFGLKIIANIRKEMKHTYMESATVSVQTNEQTDKKKDWKSAICLKVLRCLVCILWQKTFTITDFAKEFDNENLLLKSLV